jgi:hypothetical protein
MTPLRAEPETGAWGWNVDVGHAVGMPSSGLPYIHAYNVKFVHCNRNFGAMPNTGFSDEMPSPFVIARKNDLHTGQSPR